MFLILSNRSRNRCLACCDTLDRHGVVVYDRHRTLGTAGKRNLFSVFEIRLLKFKRQLITLLYRDLCRLEGDSIYRLLGHNHLARCGKRLVFLILSNRSRNRCLACRYPLYGHGFIVHYLHDPHSTASKGNGLICF